MALKDAPELQPYILQMVEHTGKILGSGSFGSVEELRFNHAPCAGKKIHGILIDPRVMGYARQVLKFEQECKLMKELRYPHIVQFMGLCFYDGSNAPVIVMELLDSNIEQWISSCSSEKELPLSLKCNILHDTSKGLHYLHSHNPQIIHRDMTARNVLLTSSMRAKIADLGNAFIVPPHHLTKTMTRVPGTIPYMPPEAFQPDTRYTEKLDMFSFGHLALYVMIQEEPYFHLLPPTYPDPNNQDHTIGRSELERREYYFNKLCMMFAKSHDITTLIQACLHNTSVRRPSASQVIKTFNDFLKEYKDDYLVYDNLNRHEMAEKLRETQDGVFGDSGKVPTKKGRILGIKWQIMVRISIMSFL